MFPLRTELHINSTAAGGVVLGPYALANQGDAPKRRFNCLITNIGRETNDDNLVIKAQQADTVAGVWSDVDAGTVTVNLGTQELYEFYVEGAAAYWRLYSTGLGEGVVQFFENDIEDGIVAI